MVGTSHTSCTSRQLALREGQRQQPGRPKKNCFLPSSTISSPALFQRKLTKKHQRESEKKEKKHTNSITSQHGRTVSASSRFSVNSTTTFLSLHSAHATVPPSPPPGPSIFLIRILESTSPRQPRISRVDSTHSFPASGERPLPLRTQIPLLVHTIIQPTASPPPPLLPLRFSFTRRHTPTPPVPLLTFTQQGSLPPFPSLFYDIFPRAPFPSLSSC